MDQRKRIDKILEAVEERIQEEVGSLLGGDPFVFLDSNRELIEKSEAFDRLSGKQICAHIDISGERPGRGCLLIGIKDAIRLAGTLIMLPASELEEVVAREDYSEEIEDSYGEIANIIAGAYGADFEQMYSEPCRFIRKNQEILVPGKVDIESEDPIGNQTYYQVSCSMTLGGRPMGELIMLLPASTFGMVQQGVNEEKNIDPDSPNDNPSPEKLSEDSPLAENEEDIATDSTTADQMPQEVRKQSFDNEKHKSMVDQLLAACQEKMGSEIGALLGADVTLTDLNNRLLSKDEFFLEQVTGRQVFTDMEVTGAAYNKSYLSIDLKDAIQLGGILVMLPPAELDIVVNEEEFGDDVSDAYGEVANIISGIYTVNFEEQYSEKLRFVKKELRVVEPLQVVSESEDPIPDKRYYCSSMSLQVEKKQLGKIHMLFPGDMLQLDSLQQAVEDTGQIPVESQEEEQVVAQDTINTSSEQIGAETNGFEVAREERTDSYSSEYVDILLIEDDDVEAEKIADVLRTMGYSVKMVSFKDNVHNYISGELKAIYLVMKDINEHSFGMAIKVSAASSMPLIAAGARWTKTKVIKAVKYGVRDILLTPASKQDIQDTAANNLTKLAA